MTNAQPRVPCLFCGSVTNTPSMEHIFHEAFGRAIPHSATTARIDYVHDVPGEEIINMPVSMFGQKVRGACKECNQSWMNSWDTDVQQLVIGLANARASEITADQVAPFARWATKVALMRTVVNRGTGGVADSQIFRDLFSTGLPPVPTTVRVGLTTQVAREGGSNGFLQIATVDTPAEAEAVMQNDADPRRKRINVVSWGMGSLYVHVTLAPAIGAQRHVRRVQRSVDAIAGLELPKVWPNDRRAVRLATPLQSATSVRISNAGHLFEGTPLRPGDYVAAGQPAQL